MLWRRALLFTLIGLNLFLLYGFFLGNDGLFTYLELKEQYRDLTSILEKTHGKCIDLSQEIRWLKSDREFIEKMTRNKMNYLKQNEILYIFPQSSETTEQGRAGRDLES
ncbi:FtsB family cell division protein [Desulfovibrio inopinatus]|uniref:FtsB family cell division protein n=1 Tax=Desulfovibrio inopinatus TaxID=102109 RepID=UPI00048064DA|nr:septum formation initiator family protein [Desulfovibrio inopinatus]